MQLDGKGLGRLRRVADARSVWASESGDFTPWLAENIDVLADELGMSLTVVDQEVNVGSFRLDIHAKDSNDRSVIIENQLERTDHSHLGQCIVYASGLEASTVIWVAGEFREEFRSALDWLNENTGNDIGFFGVEVGVVQIEEGPPAPVFDVVSRPNDWQKTVKTSSTPRPGSSINEARQDMFREIISAANAQRSGISVPKPQPANWIGFSFGPFGWWGLTATKDRRLRIEAYIDTYDKAVNKTLFDRFANEAEQWEARVGFPLDWERLDDIRSSRISVSRPLDLDDPDNRAQVRAWAIPALIAMFDALNTELRTTGKQMRAAAAAAAAVRGDGDRGGQED